MTLRDFMEAFSINTGVTVTLVNADGEEMIKFNANGYENIESDILGRDVKKVKVESSTGVKVSIADATP